MFTLCFLFWLILWGRIALDIVLIGLFLSAAVCFFACRFMGYSPRTELRMLQKCAAAVSYIVLLVYETARSNIAVSRIVFSKMIEVAPTIVFFTTELKTQAAQVALANSITLTPGTITVTLQDGLYCVHCLDYKMADGIADSSLVRRLQKIEQN